MNRSSALEMYKEPAIELAAIALHDKKQRSSKRCLRQRLHAIHLLGMVDCRQSRTAEILFAALHDKHGTIRGYAARSIGRLGLIEAQEHIEARLLKSRQSTPEQNEWVIRRLIEALGKVGSRESIDVLEPYIIHEKTRIRRRTREAIAEIERRFDLT